MQEKPITYSELVELTVKTCGIINTLSAILSYGLWPYLAKALWDKWEYWGHGWKADPKTLEEAWKVWGARIEKIEPIYPSWINGSNPTT